MKIETVKITIVLANSTTITLEKFGNDFIMVNPPSGFNKEATWYIELKKSLTNIFSA